MPDLVSWIDFGLAVGCVLIGATAASKGTPLGYAGAVVFLFAGIASAMTGLYTWNGH